MKILHVITSLGTGGAEHLLVDLLPRLRDLGNDVELLVFDGKHSPFYELLEENGIEIHRLGIGGNVYNPLNIFKLMKYVRSYDVVHTHLTACQLFVPIAKILRCGGAELVTTEHSANNRRRDKWFLRLIDRWMYARYARVICISDKTQSNLETHIGKRENIVLVYNGVDTSRFLNPIKDVTNKQTFIVTMVASLSAAKDQDTLIKAVAELPDNYLLRIVGDGPRRAALEQLVKDLHIEDRVEFTGIRTDIPELLRESDINVLSSHWEGLSLSSIEGMASGRPFVASDVDGLREMVKDNGVLFPHVDHQSLAKVIRDLCENPNHYREVAEKCQEKAKQFDIGVMASEYNKTYKSL